jgi:hypothetical protein
MVSKHSRSSRVLPILVLSLLLGLGAIGCSEAPPPPIALNTPAAEIRTQLPAENVPPGSNAASNSQNLSDGEYPVQQATYEDSDGEYTLMLLDSPVATYRTTQLQMARLTDEQIQAGKKSYLKVENQQPVFYLTEDFKINYTHNIVEQRPNPTTGQTESVVVRQESNFWSPFLGSVAGNIAGQVIGNMIFRPQHYVPPQYQSGVPMRGYGGYGQRYDDAIGNYRQRYNEPPAVERNRTVFRSNGSTRRSSANNPINNRAIPRTTQTRTTQTRPSPRIATPPDMTRRDRSTGTGVGSSDLKSGDKSTKTESTPRKERSSGFGSGRSTRSGRRR